MLRRGGAVRSAKFPSEMGTFVFLSSMFARGTMRILLCFLVAAALAAATDVDVSGKSVGKL